MEPVSAGITAGAALINQMMQAAAARRAAQQALATQELGLNYQLNNQNDARTQALQNQQYGLTAQEQGQRDALAAAKGGQADRLSAAGEFRTDQAGNITYYDRDKGQWVTGYTPEQQRLRRGEEAQQRLTQAQSRRTLARGSQADEDYARQRAGYLYDRPPTEAVIQDQIGRLLRQAQGQGERAVNTLTSRWGTRTAGNLPTLRQMDNGPSPGQQLAETMLKARTAALQESQSREKAHESQYLPAMAAFEKTANVTPAMIQEGNIGRTALSQRTAGAGDRLAALADYEKQLPTLIEEGTKQKLGFLDSSGKLIGSTYDTGSRGVAAAMAGLNAAGANATKAATAGSTLGGVASLINALKPGATKTNPTAVGPTAGGTYSAADDVAGTSGDGTPTIGGWDHRYNFGPDTKGVGGEAAPFGGTAPAGAIEGYNPDPWGYNIAPSYSSPQFMAGPSQLHPDDYAQYSTPWSF